MSQSADGRPTPDGRKGALTISEPLYSIREAAPLVGVRHQEMRGLMIGLGITPRRVASALTLTEQDISRMRAAVASYDVAGHRKTPAGTHAVA